VTSEPCPRCGGAGVLWHRPLLGQLTLFEVPIPCANCCPHRPGRGPWVTCRRCGIILLEETYRNFPADSWWNRIENGKAVYQR